MQLKLMNFINNVIICRNIIINLNRFLFLLLLFLNLFVYLQR